MKKRLESELISIAHRILKLKNKSEFDQLYKETQKLYETLCTREEMSKAIDLEDFYKIPADNRDLNYGKYFELGDVQASFLEDYNSHNTHRLSIEEIKCKLLSLDLIKQELLNFK